MKVLALICSLVLASFCNANVGKYGRGIPPSPSRNYHEAELLNTVSVTGFDKVTVETTIES